MSLGTQVAGRWQVVRHPSAFWAFPSSHSSLGSTTPFPQMGGGDDATGDRSLDVLHAARTAAATGKRKRQARLTVLVTVAADEWRQQQDVLLSPNSRRVPIHETRKPPALLE